MSLINRMRKQNAIYWPPGTPDDYGKVAPGPLVELVLTTAANYRVRWEEVSQEFLDKDGTTQTSRAVVYVPELPPPALQWDDGVDLAWDDGVPLWWGDLRREIAVGGFLWLGNRADLVDEAVPGANAGAFEIRRVDRTPNLKATEFLRACYL